MKPFILLICTHFIFTGCNSNNKNQENLQLNNAEVEVGHTEVAEYSYTDSTIDKLTTSSLPKAEIIMDTLETIMGSQCDNTEKVTTFSLNDSDINKYGLELTTVSEEIEKLLNVTHCYVQIGDNQIYTINVYFNQQNESHYSASLELISINKNNYNISKLILARSYGNEQGDEIISSTIDENNIMQRKILHNYRYIHGIGKVDSSSIKLEEYFINDYGEIVRTN